MVIFEDTGRIHADQTGKFRVKSMSNVNYIMIIHTNDANAMLLHTIKMKHASELQAAYGEIYTYLTKRSYKPIFHRINNETS